MAAAFLASHGIDIDSEMARIQFGSDNDVPNTKTPHPDPSDSTSQQPNKNEVKNNAPQSIKQILNARIPGQPSSTRWDIDLEQTHVTNIQPSKTSPSSPSPMPATSSPNTINARGRLLAPSLCHPHIHLDKAFLLTHPRYTDLAPRDGTFTEAMTLTSRAKQRFATDDLLERGRRVIDESVRAGVTHFRAFYEVDAGIGMTAMEAGLLLKNESQKKCKVQICAFAQLPLFSSAAGDPRGEVIRGLMRDCAAREDVEVLGSTPYVEDDRARAERNVDWMIDLAIEFDCHLDFHLDYHLDESVQPLVWFVLRRLREKGFGEKSGRKRRTVVLGHCSRLTLFGKRDWEKLAREIHEHRLPVSFVGLPTSDLFMMRSDHDRRGTLNIPKLVREYGLNGCLGINNIGNAFTPHGSCDPLMMACSGAGVYQASTAEDVEVLYQAVSTRARKAIGIDDESDDEASSEVSGIPKQSDLVMFALEEDVWRTRKSLAEVVQLYDHCHGRTTIFQGKVTSGRAIHCMRK